jgi:hypothetical protein
MQRAMDEASAALLDGLVLRSEVKTFCYPDRYEDERGGQMWSIVEQFLQDQGVRETVAYD